MWLDSKPVIAAQNGNTSQRCLRIRGFQGR